MSIEAAGTPYSSIPCAVGEVYIQDFDGLVVDEGDSGRILPQGWAFTDDPVYSSDGRHRDSGVVYTNFINDSFPAPSRLEPGSTLYSAGEPGKPDRSLALGVPRTAGEATIQLVADVVGEDASSFHLAFDIEASDAASSRDNPGEAAFNVVLDLNSGDGFRQIMDLGDITTGATLVPPTEDFVDGNDEAYRTSFDSGRFNLDLPMGSQLRVRWKADLEAETRGWVFGLDNVSLGMFADAVGVTAILGDFDQDGLLTPADIDLLSAEIRSGNGELRFDINSDGFVDLADHQLWAESKDYANTFIGDTNLDGTVDFPDFLALSEGFGGNGGWGQGDFDGNGEVEFSDFLVLSENFGESSVAAASVPEPSTMVLSGISGFVLTMTRRRRR